MRAPYFATALRLAAENRRMKDDCESLLTALALANDSTDEARMRLRFVTHERDRTLAVVAALRADLAGYQRINAALMQTCPADARSLDG